MWAHDSTLILCPGLLTSTNAAPPPWVTKALVQFFRHLFCFKRTTKSRCGCSEISKEKRAGSHTGRNFTKRLIKGVRRNREKALGLTFFWVCWGGEGLGAGIVIPGKPLVRNLFLFPINHRIGGFHFLPPGMQRSGRFCFAYIQRHCYQKQRCSYPFLPISSGTRTALSAGCSGS